MDKPDIIDVISQHIVLKKNKGVCPFHGDTDPSLSVSPEHQTFYCFGCGEHGDVIDFIQLLFGLSFGDALRHLGIRGTDPVLIRIARKKSDKKRAFKDWQRRFKGLCWEIISLTNEPELYHIREKYRYYLSILEGNPEDIKALKEEAGEIERNGSAWTGYEWTDLFREGVRSLGGNGVCVRVSP